MSISDSFDPTLTGKYNTDETLSDVEAKMWKTDFATDGKGDTWYKTDGFHNLPPNYGTVAGSEKTIVLQPGNKLGRFDVYGKSSDFVISHGSEAET